MSKNLKVKINPEGITELFKSDEMQAYLDEVGQAVVNAAEATGKGKYSKRTHEAGFTAICNVYPDDKEAAHDNYEHNTLLRAAYGQCGLSAKKPKQ